MSVSGTTCNAHTACTHIFEECFCENQPLIQKISIVAFHILTLFIPLIIYKIIKLWSSEKSPTLKPSPPPGPDSSDDVRGSAYLSEIEKLFGEDLSQAPLKEIKDLQVEMSAAPNCEDIERLAHSNDFRNFPPVFRLRLNWHGRGLQDVIIIKYTLFLPQEAGQNSDLTALDTYPLGRAGDHVWHDYFLISPDGNSFKISDPRDPDCLPKDFRKESGYSSFPYNLYYKAIFGHFHYSVAELKKLLNDQPIGCFRGRSLVPPYMKEEAPRVTGARVFKDIPVLLGHTCREVFYSHLKIEPDFLIRGDGAAIKSEKKPGQRTNSITF